MTYESCTCGASIFTLRYRRALEWRANHRHEMSEEPLEPPVIHESMSHHERAYSVIGEELWLG